MRKIRWLLTQIAVIICFVCIIAGILDWYNPYMDFIGHVWVLQTLLYIIVPVLAVFDYRRKAHSML